MYVILNIKYNTYYEISRKKQAKEARAAEIALTLSVVNAANIGGLSTLTGTSPNLILKHFVDELVDSSKYVTIVNMIILITK